jgi:UDP-glucose 4-epimerase
MKIIVFGGSGFLGSHVADALSEAGHEVTVFDIRNSPFLRDDQKMIVGDILDEKGVESAIAGHEAVYHLAGIADIDECTKRPVDTVRYNVLGTAVILEASRKNKVNRFVFAGSVYVYSESGSFYRSSKQACELFIENYHRLYGLPYTILRYGSLYGERSDERNSIYRLLKEALANGKVVYHGTGSELREYIHVRDAALSSVTILRPEFENQHIILTGNQAMRYSDLLEMIKEMMGNKIEIVYKPKKSDTHYNVTPYNFNPKLGRKLVNNPHIDMGQGLLSCIHEIYHGLHKDRHEEMGIWMPDGEREGDKQGGNNE